MTTRITTLLHKSNMPILHLALLGTLAAAGPLAAATNDSEQDHTGHAVSANLVSPSLVETVRNATRQFLDVNAATAAKYQPFLGCVSGPDHGAMGVHYVNGDLVGDGEIDATKPEALIYEPTADGMLLVGVEYIVDAAAWMAHHSAPPVLGGQTFQLVGSPNRYGLPTFFELHVWAWRDNPNGSYVDWNTRVSCEGE